MGLVYNVGDQRYLRVYFDCYKSTDTLNSILRTRT